MRISSFIMVCVGLLIGSSIAFGGQILPHRYQDYSVQLSIGPEKGSGFFIAGSNSVYLVTARHVLFDASQTNLFLRGQSLKCTYYPTGSGHPADFTIDVATLLTMGDVRYSTNHDVALVRFEGIDTANPQLLFYDTNIVNFLDPLHTTLAVEPASYTRLFDTLMGGEDVFIVGFPSSIGLTTSLNIPLLRKGIVGGIEHINKTVILDCPSYPGNSGGPVLMKEQTSSTEYHIYIIGVVTAFIPFQQKWLNERFQYENTEIANSGYSIAESMDVVIDMFWK